MRYGELSNRLFCVHQPYLRFIFSGPGESATRQSTFLFADLGLEAGSVKPCIVEIQLLQCILECRLFSRLFCCLCQNIHHILRRFCDTIRPRQVPMERSTPFSFNVGTSGMVFIRSSAITTSVFSLPPFTWLITSPGLTETASICPPNRPVMAGLRRHTGHEKTLCPFCLPVQLPPDAR